MYLWCYIPVFLAYIQDFVDEFADELQYHAVALFLFALDHHYEAVF